MPPRSDTTDARGPDGTPALSPYLVVDDAHGLIAFLEGAFGARVMRSDADAEGRVRHAALHVADGVVMTGSSSAEWPAMPSMLHLYVPDVDRTYQDALDAGGTALQAPEDRDYGERMGAVIDPAGNQWWIATHFASRTGATGDHDQRAGDGDDTADGQRVW